LSCISDVHVVYDIDMNMVCMETDISVEEQKYHG